MNRTHKCHPHKCHPRESGDRARPYSHLIPVFAGMTILLLSLTACVNRDQADAKLTRGCAAAVEVFLAEGFKIKSIKQSTYGDSEAFGKNYRTVKMDYVETDDWADVDKTASCVFAEQFGFMNTSHKANIYQVKFDDKIFGKEGDEIHGSYEDNLKLTEKVDNALNGM